MAKKPVDPESKPTFEQRLARLEKIVEKLESGDIGLDESLKLYAEGAGLVKECRKILGEAEQRISKLAESTAGDLATEPFRPAGSTGEAEDSAR